MVVGGWWGKVSCVDRHRRRATAGEFITQAEIYWDRVAAPTLCLRLGGQNPARYGSHQNSDRRCMLNGQGRQAARQRHQGRCK